MMNKRIQQTLLYCLVTGLLFFSSCQRESSGQPIVPPNAAGAAVPIEIDSNELLPLVPGARERTVALLYIRLLESHHISQRKLDASVSREAFRLFLKSLDPLKMYFYQSDIDEFKAKYETRICDLARNRDVSPAFEIYNRFLQRVDQRVNTILEILKTPQDFTLDEEIIRKKELMNWPKTEEEAYDRWRKRIKDDILALKAEQREKDKEIEKAQAEGKTPPKAGDRRDPIERLEKRFTSFRKRMMLENHIEDGKILDDIKKAANDDVMEAYLSSISGALDPHTTYMSPSTLEHFNTQMRKALEGIGATLSSDDGYTVIKKLVKGGPAEKSGELKVDDKITGVGQGVDGKIEDVVDSKLSDVVKLIRGPKGTTVRLEIVPGDGGSAKIVEIVRDTVNLESMLAQSEVYQVGEKADGTPFNVGVILLPDFYLDMDAYRKGDFNARSTTADIKKFLKEFIAQNVDVVVLDLRFNGGGSLQEAIALTGLFIPSGNVVQTKDETSSRPQQRDDPDPSCEWTGPLVVIESKFSASASEIFTGAIKDYRRGLIVGDSRTHGKGTVQQMKDLSEMVFSGGGNYDLGAIKLTIQGFYRPSGVSPQREGVASDVIIPATTDAYEDICESDLDNALTLNKVPTARNFPKMAPYVSPEIAQILQKKSDARVNENEDFIKVKKEIEIYREIKGKKTGPLNEEKYFEELDRFNENKREKESMEDLLENEGKIKRDYYIEEVMAIAIDYLNVLNEKGITFPKERATVQKNSPLQFLFGK